MTALSVPDSPLVPSRISGPVGHWLVDAVAPGGRQDLWESGEPVSAGLVEAALVHGVEGMVARRAAETGREVPGLLPLVHGAVGRHQRALAELGTVSKALAGAGIAFLVVKGPALTRRYADPSLRSYVDLDVVVDPAQVQGALDTLEDAGARLLDANWPLLREAGVHELALLGASGTPIDLHWALGPTPFTADRTPPVERLLDRSVATELGGVEVRCLDPLDELVHVAVHAAAAGGHRLVWLADLRAVLAAARPAGSEIRVRAAEWGAEPAVALTLARMQRVLQADGVHAEGWRAGTRAWTALDALATRLSPPERTGTGGSLARLVARSSRATLAGSLTALATKSWRRATGAARDRDDLDLWSSTDPRSARYPRGGEEGRSEFLSWVRESRR